MAIIEKIANKLRKAVIKPEELGEYSSGYLPNLVRNKVKKLVAIKPEGRLLEIGSGEGLFLSEVSISCPDMKVMGVEPWDEILYKAKAKLMSRGLTEVSIIKGVSQALPFKDMSFDHVVCVNLLLNLPTRKDMEDTLTEMVRVCKKEGSVYFDFRNSLNPLIYIGYKLAPLHDPHIKVPLRMHRLGDIKNILRRLGIEKISSFGMGLNLGRFSPAIIIHGRKD